MAYEIVCESESKRYRSDCASVLTKTCEILKSKNIIAQFSLVGSGAKNLITRNGNGPYDRSIFTVLFSAYCVGCLALMSDFGTALVFFVAFLCIAFLRTGDLASIVMMTAAAAFAGGLVLHFKPYVAQRFTVWRHAWEFTQTTGYQQSRTMSAAASGGLFGTGPEDAWLKYVGAANTDLVFGVVSEEFGLLLALVCVTAVIDRVHQGSEGCQVRFVPY